MCPNIRCDGMKIFWEELNTPNFSKYPKWIVIKKDTVRFELYICFEYICWIRIFCWFSKSQTFLRVLVPFVFEIQLQFDNILIYFFFASICQFDFYTILHTVSQKK
jgi:hypothetical protein